MCGNTASNYPRISMLALAALASGAALSQDTIPEGRRVVPTSDPVRINVVKGAARAEAVATHLRIQNRELVDAWLTHGVATRATREAAQAGAAATEAMANLLDAINAGDLPAVKAVITSFVNDAVDTGVVTL